MAVSQRLELRQSQSLVMTPQLQQAIKLLQYSNLELAVFVEQELEQNPLLEADRRHEANGEADSASSEAPRRGDEDDLDDRPANGEWDGAPSGLNDWAGVSAPSGGSSGGGGGEGGDLPSFDQRMAADVTLREHLLKQTREAVSGVAERGIAEALVDSLDDAGYLAISVEELGGLLGVPGARVEAVRGKLSGLDPVGVFARTLSECLALQLRERNRLDPAMQVLLDNLELVGQRDFPRLKQLCQVDEEDLIEMLGELRALDPKPAMSFGGGEAQPLIPDILMHALGGGRYAIELNPETLPRVLINNRYYAEVAPLARGKTEKAYLSDRLQSANWLVRALDQRANTILKVSREIVKRQQQFFEKGVEYLRPMTLREVAESVGMHESTISRVTVNKFMATPRGAFELKYFFTTSIGGANGESHSAESVRHRIRGLIEAETAENVLSDDRIVELLRSEGIDIARRTVAKYREAMHISSSVRRRKEKRLHG